MNLNNDLIWLACLVAVVFAPGVAATVLLAILRWRKDKKKESEPG